MGRRISTKQRYTEESQASVMHEGKVIKLRFRPQAKTEGQRYYLDSLQNSKLTLGLGPAGVGKSFLAMSVAIEKLLDNRVNKIVLTRPVVEAGENLGFLPGTFEEKVAPYLRPLLDGVEDLVGPTMAKKLPESGRIEFAPLAYMRGRTLSHSYVVLDEAQNCTYQQLKLFVTRMGEGSQFVVNGDPSQVDLPAGKSGLMELADRMKGFDADVQVVQLFNSDIVRSDIVQRIISRLDSNLTVSGPVEPSPRQRQPASIFGTSSRA